MVGVLQSKTQLYAASKRPVSAQQKNRWQKKGWKIVLQADGTQKKVVCHTCIRQSRLQAKKR